MFLCSSPCIITYKTLKEKPNDNSDLRVVTYNTGLIMRGGYDAVEKSEIIGEYIKDFDIVFLQEFFWNPVSNGWGLKEILNDNGFDIIVPPSASFFGIEWINSGLVTAVRRSKVNVVSSEFIRYSDSESIDIYSSKGFLVNKTSSGLLLINTHAQSDYPKDEGVFPNDGMHKTSRLNQFNELHRYIKKDKSKNIILSGDFNFYDSNEVDEFIDMIDLDNYFVNRYDGIFSNLDIKENKLVDVDSDHKAIETLIKYE